MSVNRRLLLRPVSPNDDCWERIRALNMGIEGWSHEDLFELLGTGGSESVLYILDGDQIGTGLNPKWVADNYPGLIDSVFWLKPTPSATRRALGCDVSWWNSSNQRGEYTPIDFGRMYAQGARFCIHRGTIGRLTLDKAFKNNWSRLKFSPLFRGMYHLWVTNDESAQMSNVLSVLREFELDIPLVIDVEPILLPAGYYSIIDGDAIGRFMDLAEGHLGYRPIIYTGLWVLRYVAGSTSWLRDSRLWLATRSNHIPEEGEYPALPSGVLPENLVLHQFTSSLFDGREWGVTTEGLDVNVAYDLSQIL